MARIIQKQSFASLQSPALTEDELIRWMNLSPLEFSNLKRLYKLAYPQQMIHNLEQQMHRNALYKIAYNATHDANTVLLMLGNEIATRYLESIHAAIQRKDRKHSLLMRTELLSYWSLSTLQTSQS